MGTKAEEYELKWAKVVADQLKKELHETKCQVLA